MVHALDELKVALMHRVPEDIHVAMCKTQAIIDWFQVENRLELDHAYIESEIDHLDSKYDGDTLPFGPAIEDLNGSG